MASSGKRKTTMAKLNRESKLRQKRIEKAARKDARKLADANTESIGPAPSYDEDGYPIVPEQDPATPA
jgi:hypothetical protein